MTIELPCSGCGQQLRVRGEDAGRQARCPQCGQVTQIPLARPAAPLPSASPWQQPPSGQETNPYASPPTDVRQPLTPWNPVHNFAAPHRGVLVLVLGILGFVSFGCCLLLPCGPIAWILGASDLKSIRSGRMDPAGESMTKVGMILGIISTVLICLGILAYAVLIVIAIAVDGGP